MATILDSIYNTDPPKSSSTQPPPVKKTLLEDVFNNTSKGAATDIQLGQQGVGESQYDINVTPENVVNLEEIRAQKQTTLDKWGNGLVKAAGTFGTSILENTAGPVIGLGSAIIDGDISKLYNNSFSQSLDEFNQYVAQNLPNYHTKAEQDYNLIQKLGTANFWSDQALNGAAFMGAAIATGAGLNKLTSLGKLARAGKVIDEAELAANGWQALDKAAKGIRVADAVDFGKNAALMSYGESSIEARGIYNDTKNSLIQQYKTNTGGQEPDGVALQEIESRAKSAGNFGFATNLAITGTTNALLFPKLLSKGYDVNKLGLNKIELQGGKYIADAQSITSSITKEALKGSLEEGGQELGQLLTQKTLTDYYSKGFQNKGEKQDFVNSLVYGFQQSFGTEEGLENFFLGALMGGPAGAIQAKGETSDRNANTQQLADIMNTPEFKKTINSFDNFVRATNYEQDKEVALAKGNKFDYLNAEFNQNKSIAKQFIDNDGTNLLIQQYKDMQGLPEEEFKKVAGYNENEPLPKTQTEIIDNAVKFVQGLEKTNTSIQQLFPYSQELHGTPDNYKVLTDNLWHYSTSIDNVNSRIKQVNSEIFKIASNKDINISGDPTNPDLVQVDANPMDLQQITQFNDDLQVAKVYRQKLIESYNLLANPKTQTAALTDIVKTAQVQADEGILKQQATKQAQENAQLNEQKLAEQQAPQLDQIAAAENDALDTIDLNLPEEEKQQAIAQIKDNFDKQRQELLNNQEIANFSDLIAKSTSPKELDAILNQIDTKGIANPEILNQINVKREELLKPISENNVQQPSIEKVEIDTTFGNQRKRAQTIWKTTGGQDNDKKLPEQRYFRFLKESNLPKDAKLQIVTRFNNKELFDQLLDEGARKYEEKTGIDTIYTVLVDSKGKPIYSDQEGNKLKSGDVNNLVYATLLTENGVKGTSLANTQLAKDDLNNLRDGLLEQINPNTYLNVTGKSKGIVLNKENNESEIRNRYITYDPKILIEDLSNSKQGNSTSGEFQIAEDQLQSIEETIDNPLFSEELQQELRADLKAVKSPSDLGKLFKKICEL
jgi:hypothetical protein